MLAQARREFDNATKEFQKASASIQNGTSPFFAPSPSSSAAPVVAAAALPQASQQGPTRSLPQPTAATPSVKTGDQLLIEAARKLGIPTIGKTREQIQQDIIAMAQRSPDPRSTPQNRQILAIQPPELVEVVRIMCSSKIDPDFKIT